MKNLFLILTIIGFILPMSQFIPFLQENGINFILFFEQLFSNQVSSFFALDVIISYIVLICLIINEVGIIKLKYYWVPIIGGLLVGVSFGLPLFLYLKEKHLEEKGLLLKDN